MTPVTSISTFQQGENVRMVIEPKGLWEHNAYQSDNRFVLEVKRVIEDPNKLVQGSRGLAGRARWRLALHPRPLHRSPPLPPPPHPRRQSVRRSPSGSSSSNRLNPQ